MDLLHHIFAFDSESPLLFTQFYFWAFFAIAYLLFAILMEVFPKRDNTRSRGRLHMRNIYLMAISCFFYYKTSSIFLLILLFITLSDWIIAQHIYRNKLSSNIVKARLWLILSVTIDLSLLCYFKYAYFFTNMVNDLFGTQIAVFDIFAYIGNGFASSGRFLVDTIVLPVGISFYIFQVISYTADVYHDRVKPVSNLLDFGFYVSFFPQLVAGPIVRASEFIPQLYRPFRLSRHMAGMALFWILNGLTKKIILSDYLAVNFIDRVFDNPMLFTGVENLFALFAYSLQVYADFSGYTDIAIGIALLLGFYLPKSFDSPYKSLNPQEFWRRWHMSLSRWLKTYLYIPLGGNRNATFGTYFWIILIATIALILTGSWWVTGIFLGIALIVLIVALVVPSHRRLLYANLNSFITMLLGGLWHGASWNFMIWGGINGLGMIIYKLWKQMSWNIRMLLMLVLTVVVWQCDIYFSLPVLHIAHIWTGILCAGTLVRYIYHILHGHHPFTHLASAWAIAQTFTFITFTRLFFRSGSNLDPATANKQAWETATNMLNQIGGAWNSSIIPDFIREYHTIVILFVLGMIIHWLPERFKKWYRTQFCFLPLWAMVVITVLVVVVIYQFITAELQPFIYFQF